MSKQTLPWLERAVLNAWEAKITTPKTEHERLDLPVPRKVRKATPRLLLSLDVYEARSIAAVVGGETVGDVFRWLRAEFADLAREMDLEDQERGGEGEGEGRRKGLAVEMVSRGVKEACKGVSEETSRSLAVLFVRLLRRGLLLQAVPEVEGDRVFGEEKRIGEVVVVERVRIPIPRGMERKEVEGGKLPMLSDEDISVAKETFEALLEGSLGIDLEVTPHEKRARRMAEMVRSEGKLQLSNAKLGAFGVAAAMQRAVEIVEEEGRKGKGGGGEEGGEEEEGKEEGGLVKEMEFGRNGVGMTGIRVVVERLQSLQRGGKLNQLEVFDMSGNGIGGKGGVEMLEVLQQVELKTLALDGNGLSDAHSFPTALQESMGAPMWKELRRLRLGSQSLGNATAVALSRCIAEAPKLAELNLSWNCIDARGARPLLLSMKKTNVRVLDMSHNALGEGGAFAMVECVAVSENLTELHADDCGIGLEPGLVLADAIRLSRRLRTLTLDDNPLGIAAARRILAAISSVRRVDKYSMRNVKHDYIDRSDGAFAAYAPPAVAVRGKWRVASAVPDAVLPAPLRTPTQMAIHRIRTNQMEFPAILTPERLRKDRERKAALEAARKRREGKYFRSRSPRSAAGSSLSGRGFRGKEDPETAARKRIARLAAVLDLASVPATTEDLLRAEENDDGHVSISDSSVTDVRYGPGRKKVVELAYPTGGFSFRLEVFLEHCLAVLVHERCLQTVDDPMSEKKLLWSRTRHNGRLIRADPNNPTWRVPDHGILSFRVVEEEVKPPSIESGTEEETGEDESTREVLDVLEGSTKPKKGARRGKSLWAMTRSRWKQIRSTILATYAFAQGQRGEESAEQAAARTEALSRNLSMLQSSWKKHVAVLSKNAARERRRSAIEAAALSKGKTLLEARRAAEAILGAISAEERQQVEQQRELARAMAAVDADAVREGRTSVSIAALHLDQPRDRSLAKLLEKRAELFYSDQWSNASIDGVHCPRENRPPFVQGFVDTHTSGLLRLEFRSAVLQLARPVAFDLSEPRERFIFSNFLAGVEEEARNLAPSLARAIEKERGGDLNLTTDAPEIDMDDMLVKMLYKILDRATVSSKPANLKNWRVRDVAVLLEAERGKGVSTHRRRAHRTKSSFQILGGEEGKSEEDEDGKESVGKLEEVAKELAEIDKRTGAGITSSPSFSPGRKSDDGDGDGGEDGDGDDEDEDEWGWDAKLRKGWKMPTKGMFFAQFVPRTCAILRSTTEVCDLSLPRGRALAALLLRTPQFLHGAIVWNVFVDGNPVDPKLWFREADSIKSHPPPPPTHLSPTSPPPPPPPTLQTPSIAPPSPPLPPRRRIAAAEPTSFLHPPSLEEVGLGKGWKKKRRRSVAGLMRVGVWLHVDDREVMRQAGIEPLGRRGDEKRSEVLMDLNALLERAHPARKNTVHAPGSEADVGFAIHQSDSIADDIAASLGLDSAENIERAGVGMAGSGEDRTESRMLAARRRSRQHTPIQPRPSIRMAKASSFTIPPSPIPPQHPATPSKPRTLSPSPKPTLKLHTKDMDSPQLASPTSPRPTTAQIRRGSASALMIPSIDTSHRPSTSDESRQLSRTLHPSSAAPIPVPPKSPMAGGIGRGISHHRVRRVRERRKSTMSRGAAPPPSPPPPPPPPSITTPTTLPEPLLQVLPTRGVLSLELTIVRPMHAIASCGGCHWWSFTANPPKFHPATPLPRNRSGKRIAIGAIPMEPSPEDQDGGPPWLPRRGGSKSTKGGSGMGGSGGSGGGVGLFTSMKGLVRPVAPRRRVTRYTLDASVFRSRMALEVLRWRCAISALARRVTAARGTIPPPPEAPPLVSASLMRRRSSVSTSTRTPAPKTPPAIKAPLPEKVDWRAVYAGLLAGNAALPTIPAIVASGGTSDIAAVEAPLPKVASSRSKSSKPPPIPRRPRTGWPHEAGKFHPWNIAFARAKSSRRTRRRSITLLSSDAPASTITISTSPSMSPGQFPTTLTSPFATPSPTSPPASLFTPKPPVSPTTTTSSDDWGEGGGGGGGGGGEDVEEEEEEDVVEDVVDAVEVVGKGRSVGGKVVRIGLTRSDASAPGAVVVMEGGKGGKDGVVKVMAPLDTKPKLLRRPSMRDALQAAREATRTPIGGFRRGSLATDLAKVAAAALATQARDEMALRQWEEGNMELGPTASTPCSPPPWCVAGARYEDEAFLAVHIDNQPIPLPLLLLPTFKWPTQGNVTIEYLWHSIGEPLDSEVAAALVRTLASHPTDSSRIKLLETIVRKELLRLAAAHGGGPRAAAHEKAVEAAAASATAHQELHRRHRRHTHSSKRPPSSSSPKRKKPKGPGLWGGALGGKKKSEYQRGLSLEGDDDFDRRDPRPKFLLSAMQLQKIIQTISFAATMRKAVSLLLPFLVDPHRIAPVLIEIWEAESGERSLRPFDVAAAGRAADRTRARRIKRHVGTKRKKSFEKSE